MADRPVRPEAGPSGTEIEVTPEMIEAGLKELSGSLGSEVGRVEAEELVCSIFESMVLAWPKYRSTSQRR